VYALTADTPVPFIGVLLSACPGGDEVERSLTSGDVRGWPGRPQREMLEIYACRTAVSNTAMPHVAPLSDHAIAATFSAGAVVNAYSRRNVIGPCFIVTRIPC
jgi:hypothetical protein